MKWVFCLGTGLVMVLWACVQCLPQVLSGLKGSRRTHPGHSQFCPGHAGVGWVGKRISKLAKNYWACTWERMGVQ